MPGGVALAVAALLLHSEMLALSTTIITSYYYAAFFAGFLLAWRFHSSRVIFALVVLLLSHRALEFFTQGRGLHSAVGRSAFEIVATLLPLSFLALASMRDRGLKVAGIAPRLGLLLAQAIVVTLYARPMPGDGTGLLSFPLFGESFTRVTPVPPIACFGFLAALTFSAFRFFQKRKPVETGYFWSLVAVFLSLHFGGTGRLPDGYMATAGLILAASVVETSYIMAYHDELTSLPGRRAFNETIAALDGQYAIAIVDIDHFKQFNDTFGHDTGDEVLRMVASRLSRVTGGGKAFRCGGEEFAIVFVSKSAKEALDDLQLLRQLIENSVFRVRGRLERRKEQRAESSDRRKSRTMRATKVAELSPGRELSVTVSIGVAEPSTRLREPDLVIQAADKALYRAKANGRNRVEIATSGRVRAMRPKEVTA